MALVFVPDIDDLTDTLWGEHPLDRFSGNQQSVFATDTGQKDDFAADWGDKFGGGQQQLAAPGSGLIGRGVSTFA